MLAGEIVFRGLMGHGVRGCGFLLLHEGRKWLATCLHNIDAEAIDLTGEIIALVFQFRQPAGLMIELSGRRIVGARIDGVLADCVAIELRDGEIPAGLTALDPKKDVAVHGQISPLTAPVCSRRPSGETIESVQTSERSFIVVGTRNEEDEINPVGQHPVYGFGFLARMRPYMIAYHPELGRGFSGSPVLEVTGPGIARLAAIHSNSYGTDCTLTHHGKLVTA